MSDPLAGNAPQLAALVLLGAALFLMGAAINIVRRVQRISIFSALQGFLSFHAALFLILYVFDFLANGVLSTVLDGRLVFYRHFVTFARACLFVMPLVMFQPPFGVLLLLLPSIAVALSVLADVLFGYSFVSGFFTVGLLLVLLFAQRVYWRDGRVRKVAPPGPGDRYDAPLRGAGSLRPGARTLPDYSILVLVTTIVESLLLLVHGMGCAELSLHLIMALFAFLHGILIWASLRPVSDFA